MKQLLFLFLFPCLALAQYQGNANQKITLGEQTTADGLVWRGLAADTSNLMTNKIDTSAYLVLDTITEAIWLYRASTTPKWNRVVDSLNNLQGQLSLTTKVTGVLPVANGGTGQNTFTSGNILFGNGTTNINNSNNLFWDNVSGYLGVNTNVPTSMIMIRNTGNRSFDNYSPLSSNGNGANIIWSTNTTGSTKNDVAYLGAVQDGESQRSGRFYFQVANSGVPDIVMTLNKLGNLGIGAGVVDASSKLSVMGTVRINSASAPDANFFLQLNDNDAEKAKAREWATYSDKRTKTDIQPIFNAIDKVNLLNPVYYQKHDSYVENDFLNIDYDYSVKSLGFIAQEVYNVIPEAVNTGTTNELWAMDYTKIIPILTKAIQEQNALIKALEQRILTLENK